MSISRISHAFIRTLKVKTWEFFWKFSPPRASSLRPNALFRVLFPSSFLRIAQLTPEPTSLSHSASKDRSSFVFGAFLHHWILCCNWSITEPSSEYRLNVFLGYSLGSLACFRALLLCYMILANSKAYRSEFYCIGDTIQLERAETPASFHQVSD